MIIMRMIRLTMQITHTGKSVVDSFPGTGCVNLHPLQAEPPQTLPLHMLRSVTGTSRNATVITV